MSGDNPVYVESVKQGGAAQKAGLLEGDMILKVCTLIYKKWSYIYMLQFFFFLKVGGTNVRCSTHVNVVHLIKCKCLK